MDILGKLRIVFWTLVLALWASFLAQFLRKETRPTVPQIRLAQNPFPTTPTPFKLPETPAKPAGEEAPVPQPGTQHAGLPLPVHRGSLTRPTDADEILRMAQNREAEGKLPRDEDHPPAPPARTEPGRDWPEPPVNFAVAEAKHFLFYRESPPITPELSDAIESLHSRIMFDLLPFSPWTRDSKVLLYLFLTPHSYSTITRRPYWSEGASSPALRLVYAMETEKLSGTLSHELTHIYFDSFFAQEHTSPLWLSEGLAVLMQTERGQSPPNWLGENIQFLKDGRGFPLQKILDTKRLDAYDELSVRLWYAQAYSVVRFLTRVKTMDEFYAFCRNLRDGMTFNESLYRAYGLPFNRAAALEYVWKYDLKTGKITGIK